MTPGLIAPGGLLMPGAPRPPHHPIAALFPMLADDRRASFRESLDRDGQNHPIILHKGSILDGRNRERELVELGRPVSYLVFTGTLRQALDLVAAENLHRRDLTDKQRAMIAAKIATMRLGDNQHTRTDSAAQPLPLAPEPEAEHPPIGGPEPETPATYLSHAEAATLMHAPLRSVERAAAIERTGVPELQDAVKTGPISLAAGADIAKLPIEQQREIVATADPKVIKEISKKQRAEKQQASRERRLDNMRKPDATPLLTGKKYGVHYIDVPRAFEAWSSETGAEKSPENHYRVEGFDYLAGLRDKILACSAENCVVFMWAWANSLQDQLDLLAEWGFASARRRDEAGRLLRGPDGRILPPVGEGRYRTHQVWAKRNADGALHRGTGFWFIDGHELLLVGARGDVPAPLMGTQAPSLLDLPIGDHSEKPSDDIRAQIDRYFPGVAKLEWFGRVPDLAAFKERWPDWDATGNEAGVEPVREAAE